ncbi:aspartyl/asparaginyl beta-hydroxylase domain-containing protein [Kitasatospora sp. NPDC058162]|uniref:aspartyl/asparaginyl beta-hydroxylase domain-containing protein n=1 Tax=Kitasatospora sp. NPDC058162 TaxID=3346362 RepID=UPI0036DB9032
MAKSISVDHALVRKAANKYFLRSYGGDRRPRFTSPYPLFPAVRELEAKLPQLQAEIEELMKQRELGRYEDIDPVRAAQISKDWRLYYAYVLGVPNEAARKDTPTLLEFAEKTPGVVSAMVSVLEPGVNLDPHAGPYAGILRYHLCISTPEKNPPRIRVDQEYYTWKAGESIVLDDTFEHEVRNEADEPRVVIIIDFRRPLGPLADSVNRWFLRTKREASSKMIQLSNGDY